MYWSKSESKSHLHQQTFHHIQGNLYDCLDFDRKHFRASLGLIYLPVRHNDYMQLFEMQMRWQRVYSHIADQDLVYIVVHDF
jgi:hypothetical protein